MRADDLTVFAAASLKDVLNQIAADYTKVSPDKISFNFEASGPLEVEIRHGAPADIFFSADEEKMNDLDKDGLLLAGTRKDLLRNQLAIVVPGDSKLTITGPKDLAGPDVKKLSLGEAKTVPAGIYAKAYLEKAGVWSDVQAKVISAINVRAALAVVETGNADAGIVYKTDALHSKKVKTAYLVPAGGDAPPIIYPAGVVKDSKHPTAAKRFLDYLSSPKALSIFEHAGFAPASAKM